MKQRTVKRLSFLGVVVAVLSVGAIPHFPAHENLLLTIAGGAYAVAFWTMFLLWSELDFEVRDLRRELQRANGSKSQTNDD